jgi:hypothetical protein
MNTDPMNNSAVISVLRHRLPDADQAAPRQQDGFVTNTVVSVVSGNVTGEVDRVLFRTPHGRVEQFHVSRIDGIRRANIGAADIELDAAPTLASLSAVAQYLSDMMTRLDDGVAGDPDDEATVPHERRPRPPGARRADAGRRRHCHHHPHQSGLARCAVCGVVA